MDPVCQREPVPLAAPRGKKNEMEGNSVQTSLVGNGDRGVEQGEYSDHKTLGLHPFWSTTVGTEGIVNHRAILSHNGH